MTRPTIIAVVSGKGGVGKTMFAAALASELSFGKKAILVDLDFFNRGLTGLLASARSSSPSRPIKGFGVSSLGLPENWSLSEVSKDLFMVYYDDLDKSQTDALEQRRTEQLADELLDYLSYISSEAQADFVVLDCHGGPDNASFAACSIAARTVLVSEPDRITLHGTLNFLRNLRQRVEGATPDVRLVFNKVVPAFSSLFLFRFYDDFLRPEFGGRDLLAAIPFELYLTKAFERVPFLTRVYPQSQLAIKVRLALYDMFSGDASVQLPPRVTTMTRMERLSAKYYMGRWPKVFNLDFMLKVIASCALLGFGAPSLIDMLWSALQGEAYFSRKTTENLYLVSAIIMGIGAWWFVVLILANWTKDLDVFLTYRFRTRSIVAAIGACLILLAMWGSIVLLFGALVSNVIGHRNIFMSWAVVGVGGLVLGGGVASYARRGLRNIRLDRSLGEGVFRLSFVTILLLTYLVPIFYTTCCSRAQAGKPRETLGLSKSLKSKG